VPLPSMRWPDLRSYLFEPAYPIAKVTGRYPMG
jgi:hypothetical protein